MPAVWNMWSVLKVLMPLSIIWNQRRTN